MRRQGKHDRFAVLCLVFCFFACSMLAAILYKSVFPLSQQTNHREGRTRRGVKLERNTSEPIVALDKASSKSSMDVFHGDFMTQYQRKHGGAIIHFLLALYVLAGLASVCDDYFVPSLEKITQKLRMRSDVAGATFMAAGDSAPELFTSIIGVFITKSDIGLGTIVGSAAFNILFIVAICGLFAGSALHLSRWPLLRDSFCYLSSIAALIAISYDKKVYWYEALLLVCMYLLYVVIMYFNQGLEDCFERLTGFNKENVDIERNNFEEGTSLLKHDKQDIQDRKNTSSADEDQEVRIIDQSDDSPFSFPQGLISRSRWIMALPVTCLLYVTIPDCRKEKWENWYLLSFFVSVLWIALLTYVLVWMVSIIGFTLGIPDVILGLTLLAAGSSAPEVISSVMVARRGDGDMAVSNTIGSNVIDILLCLGLPWLLKTTVVDLGGHVDVLSVSIIYTLIFLIGTVIVTLIFVVLNKWYLNKCLGMIFLFLYFAFIAVATLIELKL